MTDDQTQRPQGTSPGSHIGQEPDPADEPIPGGLDRSDERVASADTQSSGEGAEEDRLQGRGDDWPHGHRQGDRAGDDDVRRAGDAG